MSGLFNHPLIGHLEAQQHLTAMARQGRLPHALLLTGPRGIGKGTLARFLTAALISGTLADAGGGDHSPSDDGGLFGDMLPPPALPPSLDSFQIDPQHPQVRLLANMAHPDVLVLERPWDDKQERRKGEIPVELVRTAIGFARRTAALAPWRVILVDAVDEMNTSAANALLKILEEPPAGMILILVSHTAARVLPTIRSRCRTIPLLPLNEAEFATLAARLYPDALRGAVSAAWQASGGRIGVAEPFLAGDSAPARWREVLGRLGNATPQDLQVAAESLGGTGADAQEQRLLAAAEIERLLAVRLRERAAQHANRAEIEGLFVLQTICRDRLQALERLNLDPKQVFLHILTLVRANLDTRLHV